jgi:small GTP-binding protein
MSHNNKSNENVIKLVVMGSGGVGKSAMSMRFVQNIFIDSYDPTIEDSYRIQKIINGKHYYMEILDTAGTEQFTVMRDLYIKNGHGFMLVYSVTAAASFHDLEHIHNQINDVTDGKHVPIMICGNKCDLVDDRVIETDAGQALADSLNCNFMETSSKTKQNIEESFMGLIQMVIDDRKKPLKRKCCFIL